MLLLPELSSKPECHKLGAYNNRDLFSHHFGGRSLKLRATLPSQAQGLEGSSCFSQLLHDPDVP